MLDDARLLLANGRLGSAVDRAYYAMVHSSRAALSGSVARQPKSHSGLRVLVVDHLVRPAVIETEFATELSAAFDLRQRCTYDPLFAVESQRAGAAVAAAGRFLSRMRDIVEEAR